MSVSSNKKQSLHFQDILSTIQEFEKRNLEWLVQQEFMGWNLWSIIKKPLFYSFKHNNYLLKGGGSKRANKSLALVKLIGYFFKVLYYSLTNRNADIIIATDVNRVERENERYIDKFFGALLNQKLTQKAIYFEHNSKKSAKGISRHINTVPFNIVLGFLWRHYAKKKSFKLKASQFADKFNNSSRTNATSLVISEKMVLELICYFYAEHKLYGFFWKLLKPNRVFIADGIPRGVVAASKIKKIPVYEFQHGFVTTDKPDYIIDGMFKPGKEKMVLPDHIMVFGQYFKDLLLKKGFWHNDEIYVLGSYPLDKVRSSIIFKIPDANEDICILWATQPTSFEDAKVVLDELSNMDLSDIRFYFKFHPLEPEFNKEWYIDLCEKHSDKFKVVEPALNFFEALNAKHILISFHSTVLLEAIALGFPVISIATKKFKTGMSGLIHHDIANAVKPLADATSIVETINKFRSSPSFAYEWSENCTKEGSYFFAEDYAKRLKNAFKVTA